MDGDRSKAAASSKNFISGLDSLRFFAALCVVASHLASNLPVLPGSPIASSLWRMASMMANGSAAVAMFFLISGFCIHLGQADSLKVDAPTFLARRGLRIGLPLIAVSIVAHLLGDWATSALKTVLWSVYCELAYYLFYPIFLTCRRLITMNQTLMAFIAVSVITAAAQGRVSFIWQYGAGTAVVCFPLWVAGAWLAERHSSADLLPYRPILGWRIAALLMCVAANLAETLSSTINAPLLVFAAAGTFCWHYIPRELARWQLVPPFALVERLGRASYSLYLVHILPIALIIQFAIAWSFGRLVVAEAIAIGLATFTFFVLSERRSHQLARKIGRSRPAPHDPLTRAAV